MHGVRPGYADGAVDGVEGEGHLHSWIPRLQVALQQEDQGQDSHGGRILLTSESQDDDEMDEFNRYIGQRQFQPRSPHGPYSQEKGKEGKGTNIIWRLPACPIPHATVMSASCL